MEVTDLISVIFLNAQKPSALLEDELFVTVVSVEFRLKQTYGITVNHTSFKRSNSGKSVTQHNTCILQNK